MKILTGDIAARHGFFTRQGGVSTGIFDTLYCAFGSSDDKAAVSENRRRVAESLSVPVICSVYQTHSATVARVTKPWETGSAPEADAMVTDRPGIGLGILTADCVPVLFSCRDKPLIGAAHAGWKGALNGVLEATVSALRDMGAEDIQAVIGPCISPKSYEVDNNFKKRFVERSPDYAVFFAPGTRDGHPMFDLPGFCRHVLKKAGVDDVQDIGRDTRAEDNLFFSYRRTTLNKDPDYGRQLSVITL
jgi:YfiH family protein